MAVDVPIPQIRKENWEVIQRILRERIPNHVVEQIVEVAKAVPDERLQQRTAGQIVEMTAAEIMDEIAEVVKIVLHERVRQHFAQQAVDVPGRHIVKETIEGVKVVCPERVPERTAEQVDVPVSEDVEQTTGMPVLVNGGRVTAAGGDAVYVKKLIVNDSLSSFNRVASEILFQPLHPQTGISLHDEHVNTLHEEACKVSSRGNIDESFMDERGAGASLRSARSCRSSRYRKQRTSWPALIYFICVKWETELEDFSPQMKLIIIDFLPRCLGPLRDRATDYCSGCMHAGGIKEFYECEYDLKSEEFRKMIELPGGADDSHVCGAVEWIRKLRTDMEEYGHAALRSTCARDEDDEGALRTGSPSCASTSRCSRANVQ